MIIHDQVLLPPHCLGSLAGPTESRGLPFLDPSNAAMEDPIDVFGWMFTDAMFAMTSEHS